MAGERSVYDSRHGEAERFGLAMGWMKGANVESYWSSVLKRRLSRRRAIAATGASAAAAAFLAACGGSDNESGDSNELVTKPVDTSKQAKRGGVSFMS